MDHKNKVELVGFYGGDRTHCQAAWTSTGKTLTPEQEARIPGLLKMLVEGSDGKPHTSPFERSILHFQATSEIASHIHFIKHRIGLSLNGESARYKEFTEDKFYLPDDWPDDLQLELERHALDAYAKYHDAVKRLVDSGVSRKRAKESARFFLPYATQINVDFNFNFSSFVHFQKLRNAPGAQKEIREIAQQMLDLVKTETGGAFTHSLEAWGL